MKFYSKYGDRPPKCTIKKFDVSRTDASFEKECKIDRIIYKYTHNLPLENYQRSMANGQYLDATAIPTDPDELTKFFDAVNAQFMAVPAEIRKEYGDNAFAFAKAVSGEDFEKSDAAKRLDKAIRASREVLNPTLTALLNKAKEERAELISGIKDAINENKKETIKNEA